MVFKLFSLVRKGEVLYRSIVILSLGHSFGGLLAAAVNSTLWHQSCLSIEELQSNVACIAFAPPLVSVEMIVECLQNVPEAKENTYFFYYKNDVIPRILSNVEKSKVKEVCKSLTVLVLLQFIIVTIICCFKASGRITYLFCKQQSK